MKRVIWSLLFTFKCNELSQTRNVHIVNELLLIKRDVISFAFPLVLFFLLPLRDTRSPRRVTDMILNKYIWYIFVKVRPTIRTNWISRFSHVQYIVSGCQCVTCGCVPYLCIVQINTSSVVLSSSSFLLSELYSVPRKMQIEPIVCKCVCLCRMWNMIAVEFLFIHVRRKKQDRFWVHPCLSLLFGFLSDFLFAYRFTFKCVFCFGSTTLAIRIEIVFWINFENKRLNSVRWNWAVWEWMEMVNFTKLKCI